MITADEQLKLSENIDKLVDDVERNLASHLDENLYLPIKEELRGKTIHSLGIKKELFKGHMESELDKLKTKLKKIIHEESK